MGVILLLARRSDVEARSVRKPERRGAEALVRARARAELPGQGPRERHPVSFDRQVEIREGSAEEKIPHRAPHQVQRPPFLHREPPRRGKPLSQGGRKGPQTR